MTAPLIVADRTGPYDKLEKGMVGKNFHVGLGTTDPATGKTNMYGYVLVPEHIGGTGFEERIDLSTRDKLIQIASPNIIDRDLVTIPRVTDGDFSGGGLQQVWLNPKQYYDSDLEIRVPGNLQLRSAWSRKTLQNPVGAQVAPALSGIAVAFKGDVYISFGETGPNRIYNSTGGLTTPFPTYSMDTDGRYLYGADRSGNVWYSTDGAVFATLATGIDNGITNIWGASLGTVGQFLYYAFAVGGGTNPALSLSRIDLSQTPFPLGPANVDPVPVGGFNPYAVVDLVEFAGGIAILCNQAQGEGMAVYYHDGVTMQLLLKIHDYQGVGICDCLGELYVTANSFGNFEPPVLLRISSGSFNVVARWGSLLAAPARATPPTIGGPVASGQYVAYNVVQPAINGVTQTSFVALYDALNDSSSHAGALDGLDFPAAAAKSVAFLGRALFTPYILAGGVASVQFQTAQQLGAFIPGGGGFLPAAQQWLGAVPYPLQAVSGRLVSSLFDFGTPAIAKQFRRVTAHHAALQAGESITVQAFVNSDPVKYTQALPPTATVTHNYAGGDLNPNNTVLRLPAHVLGTSMYFVLILGAGTNQQTTPTVYWVSVEISPGWAVEFTVACTSKLLDMGTGRDDPQQLLGSDRYGLLHNAWENGQVLTYWAPNGNTLFMAIQDCRFRNPDPKKFATPLSASDQEYFCHLVLVETDTPDT